MFKLLYYSLVKKMHFIVHKWGIYRLWSWIYVNTWHKKYSNIELMSNLSPIEADRALSGLTWRPDGIKEFYDVVGSPQFVQHCINEVNMDEEQPAGALDCDDFSIWCVNVLNKKYKPQFFTVGWFDGLRPSGHAVCLYEDIVDKNIYHMSNWGIRGPFNTIEESVTDITVLTDAGEPIGFSLYSRNFRLLDVG